ncbi:exodeoxyribonuclease VII large subunit [Cognatiyoonia sp. IB215446]|uniref:exodeoxyribonuclease VII large subunit n=1 Tax=Cognatiyoonia sp. IB215446 TaxID=3097355 RepID=UPI002A131185|nr:exodeoxyribonuclease VII large subunit [Cognatiyoonia sp. IB215446]MDX8347747.1 exodeoxyribonuclease VII large subunit [Cognatiyoonia sp. IB215446]
MNDLFEDEPSDNTPEFTVAEISGAVKKAIEGGFSHVRVRGEVGRVSRPASGHLYLDLKDDRAVLAGVIWKGRAQSLAHRPEEGMEVVATGKLTTFPGQSKYQMVIEDIAPAGAGALMAMLEKRKAQLAAEGLFAPERKKPLPYLPEIIGVVTSPSGAVIRDILHRLRDRFPRKVLVWPVAVQGQKCAPEVAAAISGFNKLTPGGALPRPDLLIVARGGGSLEDLWGFNEEIVARAAAASEIPLISAVGHETDTTLIDYVADQRAPTPTAAAELAVPVRMELLAWVDGQGARLSRALSSGISQRGQRLRDLGRALPQAETLVEVPRQRLDYLGERLPNALHATATQKRLKLSEAALRPTMLTRKLAEDRRRLDGLAGRLTPALQRRSRDAARALESTARGLRSTALRARTDRQRELFEAVSRRLSDQALRGQADRVARLAALDRVRETLGYVATLKRGYAVVRDEKAVVTDVAGAKAARDLQIEFADGRITVSADPQGRLF